MSWIFSKNKTLNAKFSKMKISEPVRHSSGPGEIA
jgi:hypothetical protein